MKEDRCERTPRRYRRRWAKPGGLFLPMAVAADAARRTRMGGDR